VTRAFGNPNLKKLIISEPEIKTVALADDDEILVLASDGIF
jgi:serine/threonine protein phosphatase PrpC